jgi:hypothetical protein
MGTSAPAPLMQRRSSGPYPLEYAKGANVKPSSGGGPGGGGGEGGGGDWQVTPVAGPVQTPVVADHAQAEKLPSACSRYRASQSAADT